MIYDIYMHICIQYDVSLVFTLQNILIKINYVTRKAISVFFFGKNYDYALRGTFLGKFAVGGTPTSYDNLGDGVLQGHSCKAILFLQGFIYFGTQILKTVVLG